MPIVLDGRQSRSFNLLNTLKNIPLTDEQAEELRPILLRWKARERLKILIDVLENKSTDELKKELIALKTEMILLDENCELKHVEGMYGL